MWILCCASFEVLFGSMKNSSSAIDKLDHQGRNFRRAARRISTGSTTGAGLYGGQVAGSRQARPPLQEDGTLGLSGLDHRVRRMARLVSTGSTSGSGDWLAGSRQARPAGQEPSEAGSPGLCKLDTRRGDLQTGAAILRPLGERGIRHTESSGWLALDAHERALGDAAESAVPRELVKVVTCDE